jgi:hypothetical protein
VGAQLRAASSGRARLYSIVVCGVAVDERRRRQRKVLLVVSSTEPSQGVLTVHGMHLTDLYR